VEVFKRNSTLKCWLQVTGGQPLLLWTIASAINTIYKLDSRLKGMLQHRIHLCSYLITWS